jgi:hypothetical protein
LNAAYVFALFGLVGAIIGGLTSFGTTWLTQRTQLLDKHLEAEKTKREQLFNDFIAETCRLYGDAMTHEKDDVADLIQLYAVLTKMRVVSSRIVVNAAEQVMENIIESYRAPNLALHEIPGLLQDTHMNFLTNFGEACRNELEKIAKSRAM